SILLILPLFIETVRSEAAVQELIVRTAVSQLGRYDQDLDCPERGCYFGKGKNWCSEFVSWVYRKAGVPFSGGGQRDWLLNDTRKIIAWFSERQSYVDRRSAYWSTYLPEPGDYVFIGRANPSGGLTDREHSGIVEFVDASGALHTIEGNNHH